MTRLILVFSLALAGCEASPHADQEATHDERLVSLPYLSTAPPKDRGFATAVVRVRRSASRTFAELDAGSRDGLKEGDVLTVGRGSRFVCKLRLTTVDPNGSVGVATLEDPLQGRGVEVGDRAYARRGR